MSDSADNDARLIHWNSGGLGLILPGHDHDPDEMQRLGEREFGSPVRIEQHWLTYMPRVKWCGNYDGWPCENEGDWHPHWFACKPSPGADFTLLFPTVIASATGDPA